MQLKKNRHPPGPADIMLPIIRKTHNILVGVILKGSNTTITSSKYSVCHYIVCLQA